MATYFLIYDPNTRLFVHEGRELRFTYNISHAKHLTSEWSAKQVISRWADDLAGVIIRKTQSY